MHRWLAIGLISTVAAAGCGVDGVSVDNALTDPTVEPSPAPTTEGVPAEPTPKSGPVDPTPVEPAAEASPTPESLPDLVERVRTGVVRVDVIACDGGGTGTGFLIGTDLVATAAHVVDDATVVGLDIDGTAGSGEVIGIDRSSDLALIRSADPLDGTVFELAETDARVGETVTVLGYPEGLPLSVTEGIVSARDRFEVFTDIGEVGPLLQTDAAINFGNSGGPIVDRRGEIVGVVTGILTFANGIAWGVQVEHARPIFDGWAAEPQPEAVPDCDGLLLGPNYFQEIAVAADAVDHPDLAGIVASFDTYFGGINLADYADAYGVLLESVTGVGNFEAFAAAVETTWDTDVTIDAIETLDDGGISVDLTFTSFQAPDKSVDGTQDCTLWDINYSMLLVEDRWRIADATNNPGSPRACV